MSLHLINVSAVFLVDAGSPSAFNPDVLIRSKIIPPNWRLETDAVITPVLTVLKFDSGFSFVAEPNKIQLNDGNPPKDVSQSHIIQAGQKLLSKFDYLGYRAVGINHASVLWHDDAEKYLLAHFLKPGAWQDESEGAGITLSYSVDNATLKLNYHAGTAQLAHTENDRPGVIVTSNYHTEVGSTRTVNQQLIKARSAIKKAPEFYDHYKKLVSKTLGVEHS